MPHVTLKIDELVLDQQNPRHPPSTSQREALQNIIDDQDNKLAELVESIVDQEALNPMERMLVLREGTSPRRFVVLEGNRRAAALKILLNPAVLGSLKLRPGLRRRLETAAAKFNRKSVEPIAAFQLSDRSEAEYWLRLRHTGENSGRGIVDWSTQQQVRFVGTSPALQAIDFILIQGALNDEEKGALQGRFITTLARLLDSPDVRQEIGVDVRGGRLLTGLPAEEVVKPLRKIIMDLAFKRKTVTELKKVEQMLRYVRGFEEGDRADLTKLGKLTEIEDVSHQPSAEPAATDDSPEKQTKKKRNRPASKRDCIVPPGYNISILDARPAAIFEELRTLKFRDAPNAIAVLLRVFIELSIDRHLEINGERLYIEKGGNKHFKKFQDKFKESVQLAIKGGAEERVFVPLQSDIHDEKSPMYYELLHSYVHNKFSTPDADKLKAAWDHARPLMEAAWS